MKDSIEYLWKVYSGVLIQKLYIAFWHLNIEVMTKNSFGKAAHILKRVFCYTSTGLHIHFCNVIDQFF